MTRSTVALSRIGKSRVCVKGDLKRRFCIDFKHENEKKNMWGEGEIQESVSVGFSVKQPSWQSVSQTCRPSCPASGQIQIAPTSVS